MDWTSISPTRASPASRAALWPSERPSWRWAMLLSPWYSYSALNRPVKASVSAVLPKSGTTPSSAPPLLLSVLRPKGHSVNLMPPVGATRVTVRFGCDGSN